jgi:hypothetical protein
MIKVIVNADDFGLSSKFNEKILEAGRDGAITSVSVMVNRINKEQDEQVRSLLRLRDSGIGIGLHLEVYNPGTEHDDMRVQFKRFCEIFGRPDHLDLHTLKGAIIGLNSAIGLARAEGLPMRNHGLMQGIRTTTAMPFFVTNHSWSSTLHFVEGMRDGHSYELAGHPGEFDLDCHDKLNASRIVDYEVLEFVKEILQSRGNVWLTNFSAI